MKNNYLKQLLTALLLLCGTAAGAHDFEVDGIYYNISDATAKTVKVTYKGSSFRESDYEYTGSVVIPETVIYNGVTYSVTSIGDDAFHFCTHIINIEIPCTVTNIGCKAFRNCWSLDRRTERRM